MNLDLQPEQMPTPEPEPKSKPNAMKGVKAGFGSSFAGVFDIDGGFAYSRPLTKNLSVVSEANINMLYVSPYDIMFFGADVPVLLQLSTNNKEKFMVFAESGVSAELHFGNLGKDRILTIVNLGLTAGLGIGYRAGWMKRGRMEFFIEGNLGTAYYSFMSVGWRIFPW
jgi:hypothetical protein